MARRLGRFLGVTDLFRSQAELAAAHDAHAAAFAVATSQMATIARRLRQLELSATTPAIEWSADGFGASLYGSHAQYLDACDRAYGDLRLVQNFRPFSDAVPTVVCVARNEASRIRDFIEHYLAIGAQTIHLIDNASTDETARIATAYPAVTLWETTSSFAAAGFGQMWIGGLVRRHGLGSWVINVDADEFLVFPGMEHHGVAELQARLEERGQTRMLTPLIDMYAGPASGGSPGLSVWEQTPYFDGGSQDGPSSYRVDASALGPTLRGGPRERMLRAIGSGENVCLRKAAVSRWHASTAYANMHFPFPFEETPAEASAGLLHFKFLADFSEKVDEAIAEGQHWNDSVEYRWYRQWLSSADGSLYEPSMSRRYESPACLIDAGLIVPFDWGGVDT